MDAASTSLAPAKSIRGEWRQYLAFLKRPVVPGRAPGPRWASLRALLRLFLLDVLVMGGLLLAVGLVMSSGVSVPETALAGVEIGATVIFAVVVIAPLTEEIAFRSWMSGRPGHILGLLAAIPVGVIAALGYTSVAPAGFGQMMAGVAVGVAAAVVVALAIVYLLRRRGAMRWFQRLFPLFFWLGTAAFSLVHLMNFPADQLAMALPLVAPQFITGTMLGYVRVAYGLWASMLLHTLHNAFFIALVLTAGSAGAG